MDALLTLLPLKLPNPLRWPLRIPLFTRSTLCEVLGTEFWLRGLKLSCVLEDSLWLNLFNLLGRLLLRAGFWGLEVRCQSWVLAVAWKISEEIRAVLSNIWFMLVSYSSVGFF